MNEVRLLSVMSGEDRSLRGLAGRVGLAMLEPGYRLAVATRNRLFDAGLRERARLPRPAISVGNLTAGGTGKTPMVIELVRRLVQLDQRPAVLLRGYQPPNSLRSNNRYDRNRVGPCLAPQQFSDEAALLGRELGEHIPVGADADRVAAAHLVLARSPDVTVFVLDDAFQHRQVHRDLDLVLIDATRPFGYGHLLPRGLLREPARNLRRADAVIITRADRLSLEELHKLDERIRDLAGRPAAAYARYTWTELRDGETEESRPVDDLRTMRVMAVCGLGNPKAFLDTLRDNAKELAHAAVFGDHHAYTAPEIVSLFQEAERHRVDAIVLTEKDWVKWAPLAAELRRPVPILRPTLAIQFLDGGEAVDALLRDVVRW